MPAMLENLPYFQQHLESDLGQVNLVINQAVQSDVALISQIGTYIISAGGKRLRPVITILAGKFYYKMSDLENLLESGYVKGKRKPSGAR